MLNSYETLFIIRAGLDEEASKALVDKFKNLLESSATLENMDEWGKRRLAYPVMDEMEGYYVLANFQSQSDFPAELERIFKITDGILKYLIIKKEK